MSPNSFKRLMRFQLIWLEKTMDYYFLWVQDGDKKPEKIMSCFISPYGRIDHEILDVIDEYLEKGYTFLGNC